MPGASPYRIEYLPTAKQDFRKLYLQARQRGELPKLVAAARAVEQRLGIDPLVFGEATYDLHEAAIQVRVGGISMLSFEYGVSLAQSLVFVRQIRSVGARPE